MKTIKYSLVFLGLILIGSFIYGKFFFDLDDYKGDITNYVSEKINYDFTYNGELILEYEPNATIIVTKIVISDPNKNQIITKIDKLVLSINKDKILNNIIDVETVDISNMILYGQNVDEMLMKTYKLIKDQKYSSYTNNNFTIIERMKANALVDNDIMRVNNIDITTSLLQIKGNGVININSKVIDFIMTGFLRNKNDVATIYKQEYPEELYENKLPIKLKGNIENIDFSVDLTDIITRQIVNPIKDKILEELEEKVREKIRLPF